MDQQQSVTVPDIAVREIGALHLQLAAAHQRIEELERERAAFLATKPVAEAAAQ